MTREEAKEELIQSLTDNHIPDPEAVEMAIKALEQEPVFDKIRAEIEEERKGYPPSADYYKAINRVLEIINKHKAESGEYPQGQQNGNESLNN